MMLARGAETQGRFPTKNELTSEQEIKKPRTIQKTAVALRCKPVVLPIKQF
jgi:hypothetical protein